MSGRYREHVGEKTVTDHHTGQGFGLTGHFREGPPSGILHVPSWTPPAIDCTPHTPVIEVPSPTPADPVSQVPDTVATAALLGLALFAVGLLKRFKR